MVKSDPLDELFPETPEKPEEYVLTTLRMPLALRHELVRLAKARAVSIAELERRILQAFVDRLKRR